MPKYVRVLEHDTADQIRVGYQFPTHDLEKTANDVFEQENAKLRWCGGAWLCAPRFYRRIALVDANTLTTVMDIYDGREWAPCLNR